MQCYGPEAAALADMVGNAKPLDCPDHAKEGMLILEERKLAVLNLVLCHAMGQQLRPRDPGMTLDVGYSEHGDYLSSAYMPPRRRLTKPNDSATLKASRYSFIATL